jgi:hemerythrin-like domain-containing protein
MESTRRHFLATSTALGVATFGMSPVLVRGDDKKPETADEVSAAEDLMREHGILNRILLIYEEGLRRLRDKEDVAADVFHKPAMLVRNFVEDYHEKLEEKFIFPEFEKAQKHIELVTVLREQHEAGRRLTDVILRNAVADQFRQEEACRELVRSCLSFIRMYRPHEAREDTVLFPALHQIVRAEKLKELGEQFEKEENRLFGEDGFEKTVEQVAVIEKQLGIGELKAFTPK